MRIAALAALALSACGSGAGKASLPDTGPGGRAVRVLRWTLHSSGWRGLVLAR